MYNDSIDLDGGAINDEVDDRTENWRQYVENDDAEVPEDEFGDMTSIATEDELEGLDGEEIDFGDEDFDEEIPEELEEEFAEDDDFAEDFDDDFADEDEDEFSDDDEYDDEYDDKDEKDDKDDE